MQVGIYRKKQGIVYLKIDLGGPQNTSISSSGTVLGTLSAGYRPTSTHSTGMIFGASSKSATPAQLTVTSDGTVTGFIFGTNASIYFGATAVFPADN